MHGGVWSSGDYALGNTEPLPLSSGFPEREKLFSLRMGMVPGRKKKGLTLMGIWAAQIGQISHVLTHLWFLDIKQRKPSHKYNPREPRQQ